VEAVAWLAEESASSAFNLGTLAQYGVLGVFAAMLVWFAKGAHQRERDRGDRLEGEVQRLNALIADRVIPTLNSASRAAEDSAELLNAIQRERELRRMVEERRPQREDA
jgi:hypothetical protein